MKIPTKIVIYFEYIFEPALLKLKLNRLFDTFFFYVFNVPMQWLISGQRFALLLLKIAVATVIKSYKIRSLDPEEKLGLVGEIVLNAMNGINITIEKRT